MLVRQVEQDSSVANGAAFVEKIFQNIITVPPQEPFALRRHLRKLLESNFSDALERVSLDRDASYREHLVFDVWSGRFLRTPRDVVRLHEAVKLGWRHLPPGSDFLDFVWLQLVKLKCPTLYVWVRNYLMEIASYRDDGRPSDNEPANQAARLVEIMSEFGWSEKGYQSGLGTILPGVGSFVLQGEGRTVFNFSGGELDKFESSCRLGSPTHWRQYFAFSLPSYALSDDYIVQFREFAKGDVGAAVGMIRDLLKRRHQKKGHFVDVLLDRLRDARERRGVSIIEAVGTARVFADVMDEVALATAEFNDSGRSAIWDKAIRLLTKDVASEALTLVRQGRSVNWLAAALRDQGFAHGNPEGNRPDEDRQWLTTAQLNSAVGVFVDRLNAMAPKEIFGMPSPLYVLFCWLQLGSEENARKFVDKAIREDEGLVHFAEAMRGWSASSTFGVRHPIRSQYIELFTDARLAKQRIQEIAEAKDAHELAARAKVVLAEWTDEKFG